MVKVVIINGMPMSGKTTFEELCQKICDPFAKESGFEEDNILCVDICSTVDFVKIVAKQCGWDGTKDLKNRKFLSDLKIGKTKSCKSCAARYRGKQIKIGDKYEVRYRICSKSTFG